MGRSNNITVEDIDLGWNKMVRDTRAINNHQGADVGFHEGDTHPDRNMPIAHIAFLNEFGHNSPSGNPHTPPRRFMRRATLHGHDKLPEEVIKQMNLLYEGSITPDEFVNNIGMEMVGIIQDSIDNEPLRNSHETARKKGHDTPLRDTNTMYNSVKSKKARN